MIERRLTNGILINPFVKRLRLEYATTSGFARKLDRVFSFLICVHIDRAPIAAVSRATAPAPPSTLNAIDTTTRAHRCAGRGRHARAGAWRADEGGKERP